MPVATCIADTFGCPPMYRGPSNTLKSTPLEIDALKVTSTPFISILKSPVLLRFLRMTVYHVSVSNGSVTVKICGEKHSVRVKSDIMLDERGIAP